MCLTPLHEQLLTADKTMDDLYVCQAGRNIKWSYISFSISCLSWYFYIFFFALTKVLKLRPGRNSIQNLWKRNKYLSRQVFRCCWTFQNGSWPHTCTGPRQTWRCWWYVGSRHPWRSVWGDKISKIFLERISVTSRFNGPNVGFNDLQFQVNINKCCNRCSKNNTELK